MYYGYAKKIVATGGEIVNAETLLKEKTMQISVGETDLCSIKGKGYILFDFGKELSGGARIFTHGAGKGVKVRLRFGESVSETCAEIGEKNATNDHSLRDMEVSLQSYSDMTFGQTGYRFLRVDFLEEDKTLTLKSVVATIDTDTREETGKFECDDELVNTIWNTAAYTLRLCLQNGYIWDGIKRDRLVWIGDLYPEMRTARCLFDEVPETLKCLDFSMEQSPLPRWANGMPAYSLWWLIILCDEYKMRGDKELFKKYLSYTKGLVEQVSSFVQEDGTTTYPGHFVDWPSNYVAGEPIEKDEASHAGVAYLTKIAMEKTAEFLTEYGEDTALCREICARLSRKERKVHWFKQVAAIGVWSGDQSENNKKVLLEGGAKGLSTFMSYPILTAVAAYGEYEKALSMMKEYYGGMLSVGATTFWEDFDLDWLKGAGRIDELPKAGEKDIHGDYGAFCYKGFRHSFCHGWSAGVIPYLMETVAGIKVEGSGMKTIRIQPQLSGLKHVKVSYPTPYGVLKVEHTLQENGEVKTEISAPKEIEIVR
ncbi:MAG: alpha-L-rhamnosidase [Clostridia bacterium]|nr:alpha-L-rhamnosidase [Clostridia bacterium]